MEFGLFKVSVLCICLIQVISANSINNGVENVLFREKCLGELGCFSNGPPFFDIWNRPLSLLPDDRENVGTVFHLIISGRIISPADITNLNRRKDTLLELGFQTERETIFIIPGYINEYAPSLHTELGETLVNTGKFNVFVVSWTGDGPLYEQAVANTRVVGAELALFINFLEENLHADRKAIHLIGHSLGAHIAGYVGKRIHGLGRITGLDPAGPYFEKVDATVRLNASDAIIVDCVHTDQANSRFVGFGTTESICDLDFFPNGGDHQTGCPPKYIAAWKMLKDLFNQKSFARVICDHERAIELFISSIKNPGCPLTGVTCDSWDNFNHGQCPRCRLQDDKNCIPFGFYMRDMDRLPTKHRDLYFRTTATAPFCDHPQDTI